MLKVNLNKDFYDKGGRSFRLEISFTAGNSFTVLMGTSGAGKTSVLRLIAGILQPDSGTIEINSQIYFDSARKINLPIRERRVGYVFQDYALFPHLSAERNIAYGVKDQTRAAKIEKAHEMLALFHIEHLAGRIPREMSGGEQQRVALARALASDPLIVLLDEPLSAVDVETRVRLLDEIENAQRQIKIPFIYVTHNETEADRLGRDRLILENGRLINAVKIC